MIDGERTIHEIMDPFELQVPGLHAIANICVKTVGIGTELVQKMPICAHCCEITFIPCLDFTKGVIKMYIQLKEVGKNRW